MLVLVGAIAVIAAVWSGVGAMASPQHQQASAGLNARVRALEANVRSLKSQMASTKKKVNEVVGAQQCLTAQGLSSYGTGTTTGYYYTNDGVDGAHRPRLRRSLCDAQLPIPAKFEHHTEANSLNPRGGPGIRPLALPRHGVKLPAG